MPDREAVKKKPARKPSFLALLTLILFALLGVGLTVVAFIVVPELTRDKPGAETRQMKAERAKEEAKKKQAKRKAEKKLAEERKNPPTRRNFHCRLFTQYYQGAEPEPPVGELVGLYAGASDKQIWARCDELYESVRMMGGWPDSVLKQDNFVVCTGFEIVVLGPGSFVITPTRTDLAHGRVSYGVPGKWTLLEDIPKGYAQGMQRVVPLITQVDDRCIVIGLLRARKTGEILGKIRRAAE